MARSTVNRTFTFTLTFTSLSPFSVRYTDTMAKLSHLSLNELYLDNSSTPGTVWTGGKSRPTGILFNQHTFILAHCVHSSTFVTATVSIVSEVSVHRTRDIITPHSTVPFDPLLSLVHLAHISLPPHFTLHKSARLTHFEAHKQK